MERGESDVGIQRKGRCSVLELTVGWFCSLDR